MRFPEMLVNHTVADFLSKSNLNKEIEYYLLKVLLFSIFGYEALFEKAILQSRSHQNTFQLTIFVFHIIQIIFK